MRTPTDPLDGTIADCQAGLRRGEWTAEEVTRRALERCRRDGAAWRAIDALSATALDEARASDARRRAGTLRGPLDGVPVFAKSIYDMEGLPTTGSSAEWAYLFPGAVHRDALEVRRLRAAGAIVLGKTAADDFAYRGVGTSTHTGQVAIRLTGAAPGRRAAPAPARRWRWPAGWPSRRSAPTTAAPTGSRRCAPAWWG
ncbi:MAG: hypothetical protein IPF77_11450 [Gemmatimonadetes bacterium]|nr:hypothetical protein [Gemmatimonadota bacterium]